MFLFLVMPVVRNFQSVCGIGRKESTSPVSQQVEEAVIGRRNKRWQGVGYCQANLGVGMGSKEKTKGLSGEPV